MLNESKRDKLRFIHHNKKDQRLQISAKIMPSKLWLLETKNTSKLGRVVKNRITKKILCLTGYETSRRIVLCFFCSCSFTKFTHLFFIFQHKF